MKIIFTGDNHIFCGDDLSYYSSEFNDGQYRHLLSMMNKIKNEKPDVVCNIGDIGEILINGVNKHTLKMLQTLFSSIPTLYIPGNHDLYNNDNINPIQAFELFIKNMPHLGFSLQKQWNDKCTKYIHNNTLFIGIMGFPDFSHKKLIYPQEYYNKRYPTNDSNYMDLSLGWLHYTKLMLSGFEIKLKNELLNFKDKNVVIITHYPIFESQYNLQYDDNISPYFYCGSIGDTVKKAAVEYPDKTFYCIAGHGHEFNKGILYTFDNIASYGLKTDYNKQVYFSLEI